jgi:hypothetical protein
MVSESDIATLKLLNLVNEVSYEYDSFGSITTEDQAKSFFSWIDVITKIIKKNNLNLFNTLFQTFPKEFNDEILRQHIQNVLKNTDDTNDIKRLYLRETL